MPQVTVNESSVYDQYIEIIKDVVTSNDATKEKAVHEIYALSLLVNDLKLALDIDDCVCDSQNREISDARIRHLRNFAYHLNMKSEYKEQI